MTDHADAQRINDHTVCLVVRRGRFGNRRQASLETVTIAAGEAGTEADKSLVGLRKTILVSPELKAVASLDGEVTTYVQSVRMPTPYKFTANTILLPLRLSDEVDARLQRFHARREPLIDAAVLAYPDRMRETAERLGSLTALKDYPSAERFRACFYMEWEIFAMTTPANLTPVLLRAEQAKAAARMEAIAAECRLAMRAGLQELVDKMVTTLTPGPDGKPKRFHPSVVTHFTEFLRTFEMKNDSLDDVALARLAEQANTILRGVDVHILKSDPGSRSALAASFTSIQAALVPMVGGRVISFDEEVV